MRDMRTLTLAPVAGLLLVAAGRVANPAPRSYDVELAYIGFTGLAGSVDCGARVNSQGYDSLIGTVQGDEPTSATDDDVVTPGP